MGKRNVILFGAGAVLDWGGPKTEELTKMVRESGFFCTDNKTKITEYIFQALLKSGYNEKDISFETIINVLEELTVYYSYFDKGKHTPSIQKVFLNSNYEENLLNFKIVGGVEEYRYKMEVPIGSEYHFQSPYGAVNDEAPAQYFFQLLIAELITSIVAKISIKGGYVKNNELSAEEAVNLRVLNDKFCTWIDKIISGSGIIRMYTLNYDRLFKVILGSNGKSIFEGFECEVDIDPEKVIAADIPKILNDFSCDCYYNLHGSAHWQIETRNEGQLIDTQIFLSGYPQFQMNLVEQPNAQIERGKNILLSNIITGYQKAQKSIISPFRQMSIAFDKDCINADSLFIIGYSFGDEHINMSIKTALKYNEKIKIYIVDPIYNEQDGKGGRQILNDRFIRIFTHYLENIPLRKKLSDECYQYFDGKITVHTISMKEFLKTVTV